MECHSCFNPLFVFEGKLFFLKEKWLFFEEKTYIFHRSEIVNKSISGISYFTSLEREDILKLENIKGFSYVNKRTSVECKFPNHVFMRYITVILCKI